MHTHYSSGTVWDISCQPGIAVAFALVGVGIVFMVRWNLYVYTLPRLRRNTFGVCLDVFL